jgi:hypothetical protein
MRVRNFLALIKDYPCYETIAKLKSDKDLLGIIQHTYAKTELLGESQRFWLDRAGLTGLSQSALELCDELVLLARLPSIQVEYQNITSINGMHPVYTELSGSHKFPPICIYTLKNATILSENEYSAVYTENGLLVREISSSHQLAVDQFSKSIQRIEGAVALIQSCATLSTDEEWFLSDLPKIKQIQNFYKEPIKYWLFRHRLSDFQMQCLERFGINSDSIAILSEISELKVDLLIASSEGHHQLASLPRFYGEGSPNHFKNILNHGRSPLVQKPNRRIILDTAATALSPVVKGIDQLYSDLENDFGFERVDISRFSLQERVRCFGNAEYIVGPQHPCMVNMLFAHPRARILEIVHPRIASWTSSLLAQSLGLEYRYIMGKEGVWLDDNPIEKGIPFPQLATILSDSERREALNCISENLGISSKSNEAKHVSPAQVLLPQDILNTASSPLPESSKCEDSAGRLRALSNVSTDLLNLEITFLNKLGSTLDSNSRYLEIGGGFGASTIAVATGIKKGLQHAITQIICVDTWSPLTSIREDSSVEVYPRFLTNIEEAGVEQFITPMRISPHKAMGFFPEDYFDVIVVCNENIWTLSRSILKILESKCRDGAWVFGFLRHFNEMQEVQQYYPGLTGLSTYPSLPESMWGLKIRKTQEQ